MRRFLGNDPITGITEYFHFDDMTKEIHIESVQDVEPLLDLNRSMANDEDYTKQGIKNGTWHYASIPTIVQLKWLNEYGSKDWPMKPGNEKLLFRLLNNPEWRYLKSTGKIHAARSN